MLLSPVLHLYSSLASETRVICKEASPVMQQQSMCPVMHSKIKDSVLK